MPSYFNPKLYLRKGVTDYQTFRNNGVIIYKPNQAQIATLQLENSDGALTDTFFEEDRVSIKIEAETMLDGYINWIDKSKKKMQKLITMQIIDWVGYLSSKMPFEKNYEKLVPAYVPFLEAGLSIFDGTNHLNFTDIDYGMESKILKDYYGTYAKEVFNDVARIANADWFGDELRGLNIFRRGHRMLRHSSGNAYELTDFNPPSAWQIMVKHDSGYNFRKDATYKFRNVKVLNGQIETIPHIANIGLFESEKKTTLDSLGASYEGSNHYFFMDADRRPTFEAGPQIGSEADASVPAIKFFYGNIPSVSMFCNMAFINNFTDPPTTGQLIRLPIGKYEEIRFFFNFQPIGQAIQEISLKLVDATTDKWYQRNILPDYSSAASDGWVYFKYRLPDGILSDAFGPATSNGWQKSDPGAIINNIDYVRFDFTPSTGWDASTSAKWAFFHFWKRMNQTKTGPGNPPTTKLIVVKDNLSLNAMGDFAIKEFVRSSQARITGSATIEGNTDFKRPGYGVVVNFNATLGSDAVAFVRMGEIIHRIHEGRYVTMVNLTSPTSGV